jgi:cell division protein FtsI (penicillin-binding protein 3)
VSHSRSTRRRLALALFVIAALVIGCVVRLVDIQVVRADELTKAANLQQRLSVTTYGTRGDIVDTNGTVLAASVQRWNITASPAIALADDASFDRVSKKGVKTKVTVQDALGEIAKATGGDAQKMYTALTKDPASDFAYLVKSVDLATYTKVKDLGIPWVYSEPDTTARSYPNGAIAGNLIGFMGTDGPLAGLELSANACLAGTNGAQTYERSRDGVRIPGSTVETKAAVDGGTLKLTIDGDLEWYSSQVLAEQAAVYGAKWATAAVVRIKDGHIMAAAQYPSLDPNDVTASPQADRGSRFFQDSYEPGSIMKPATVASLLDAGAITANQNVVVPSKYDKGFPKGAFIKDVFPHPEMHWTVAGIIENSSNIGISVLSESLSVQKRTEYLKKFGFGSKTAVGFQAESAGIVHNPNTIDPISDKAQQFGQAISVTSAQMASMYQTLGNGGVQVPLTLVEGCQHPDGTVTDAPAATSTRVVSESSATAVLQMMETVATTSNISKTVSIPGYRIAAKTGTAQVATSSGKYGADRVVSVAGITTVDNPEYAVIVTLGNPDKVKTSAAAAPAFAAIMKQVIKTYRVPPSTTPVPNIPLTW